MSYVPTLEVAKQILPHRLIIKALSREAAKLYLDKHLPELDAQDLEYTLNLAGQHVPRKQPAKPQDPLFCGAMFLAGVSLGDLALLFGIQKQTIQQKIARRLSPTERHTMRDQLQAMDLEVLALCREMFNDAVAVNSNCWEGIHPLEIGRALISGANAVIARDRGEEPLTDRPRRYSNMNQPSGKEQAAEILTEAQKTIAAQLPMPFPDIHIAVSPEAIDEQLAKDFPPTPNTVRPDEQSYLDTL